MGKTYNLFVYGTLQSSYATAPFLNRLKHEKATCTGLMFNLSNRYPGCIFSRGSTVLKGEVILGVPENANGESTLDQLDVYESATGKDDAMYVRKEIEVTLASGEKIKAFAYEVTDYTLRCMPHTEIAGDWIGFITRPCPNLNEKETDYGKMSTCSLTGRSCPYCGNEDFGRIAKTGCCSLPAYAEKNPEAGIPDSVLEPIFNFFSSCMTCDMLSKHYYLNECAHGGCSSTDEQLKLRYLAKCYGDRHPETRKKENA